jgi:hypothetical protein
MEPLLLVMEPDISSGTASPRLEPRLLANRIGDLPTLSLSPTEASRWLAVDTSLAFCGRADECLILSGRPAAGQMVILFFIDSHWHSLWLVRFLSGTGDDPAGPGSLN